MEKKILRAGLVGSGFAAKFHFDALQRVFSAKVHVSGAYSPSPKNLESFTQPRNIKAYANLGELMPIAMCFTYVPHRLPTNQSL